MTDAAGTTDDAGTTHAAPARAAAWTAGCICLILLVEPWYTVHSIRAERIRLWDMLADADRGPIYPALAVAALVYLAGTLVNLAALVLLARHPRVAVVLGLPAAAAIGLPALWVRGQLPTIQHEEDDILGVADVWSESVVDGAPFLGAIMAICWVVCAVVVPGRARP